MKYVDAYKTLSASQSCPPKDFFDPPMYYKVLTLNGRITDYICCILKLHNVIESFLHKLVNVIVFRKVVHLPTVDDSIGIRTLKKVLKGSTYIQKKSSNEYTMLIIALLLLCGLIVFL